MLLRRLKEGAQLEGEVERDNKIQRLEYEVV
jgi:hypothetical protein